MKPIKEMVDPPLMKGYPPFRHHPNFDYSISWRDNETVLEPMIPPMPRGISELVKPWLATANIRGRRRW